ncbi:MAG: hypothetical protein ACLFWM_02790 [Actinomycetota bacterium]
MMLALLMLSTACQATYEGDPQALCPAVDEITETARALGPGNRLELDQIADRYRRLASAYRDAADELDDATAADDARYLAGVIEEAARDLDAVDDPAITSAADVDSRAIDEMGEIITSNLPMGFHERAMEQIEGQCEPNFDELQLP